MAEGQAPMAIIVGCADSRVAPELIFDQGVGDLFVVRVAGNIVSGAGHDACYVSRVAPTAMIFVPCKDGISHNEVEDATKADIGAGCQILLQAMVERANN